MITSDKRPEVMPKREYQPPKLVSFGSFQAMTLGNSGATGDGGKGLSKV